MSGVWMFEEFSRDVEGRRRLCKSMIPRLEAMEQTAKISIQERDDRLVETARMLWLLDVISLRVVSKKEKQSVNKVRRRVKSIRSGLRATLQKAKPAPEPEQELEVQLPDEPDPEFIEPEVNPDDPYAGLEEPVTEQQDEQAQQSDEWLEGFSNNQ